MPPPPPCRHAPGRPGRDLEGSQAGDARSWVQHQRDHGGGRPRQLCRGRNGSAVLRLAPRARHGVLWQALGAGTGQVLQGLLGRFAGEPRAAAAGSCPVLATRLPHPAARDAGPSAAEQDLHWRLRVERELLELERAEEEGEEGASRAAPPSSRASTRTGRQANGAKRQLPRSEEEVLLRKAVRCGRRRLRVKGRPNATLLLCPAPRLAGSTVATGRASSPTTRSPPCASTRRGTWPHGGRCCFGATPPGALLRRGAA